MATRRPKPSALSLSPESRPQPGRVGKVQIKAWVEPSFRKRLKALAVETDTPMETLVIQQLEALLRRHGK